MKLIVGLGNPGARYEGTRHNVGFMAIDRLAERHALGPAKGKFHADVFEGNIANRTVMLIKPATFMNRSGASVAEAVTFYKVDAADLMVIVDDTALPVGSIRIRGGGSCGGHNGLADIERRIGTSDYPRLRIGVGAPRIGDRPVPQADYVLSPFSSEQRTLIAPAIDRAADAVECFISDGLERAMNRYNTPRTVSADGPGQPEDQSS